MYTGQGKKFLTLKNIIFVSKRPVLVSFATAATADCN